MEPKVIGSYLCGYEHVELILQEGWGGELFFIEKGKLARMKLGGDQDWETCFASLLHETFEFISDRIKCRFAPCNDMSRATSAYVFVINHLDFSDICAKQAEFVNGCLPDLKKEHKLWNKKKEKKK